MPIKNSYMDEYTRLVRANDSAEKAKSAKYLEETAGYRAAVALKESAEQKRIAKMKAYPAFKESVENKFVGGFLWKICEGVLEKERMSDFSKGIAMNVIESYVKDNGARTILRNMNGKSLFLTEAADLIKSTIESVLEDVDKGNEDTYAVTPEKEQEFYDDLSDESIDDITNTIRMRVVDAEERMATDNIKDKIDMDEVMRDAADRINAVKTSNAAGDIGDESAEKQQQEAVSMSKARMNNISNKRPRSVLEQMVRSNSKKVVKDEQLARVYSENGQINFDKLVEATVAVYTVMETLNSLQIEEFDAEAIKRIVS